MSRRSANGRKLELKLNLAPPRPNNSSNNHLRAVQPPKSPSTDEEMLSSTPTSCVSSEVSQQEATSGYLSSPEATSMTLVGCPRCLMYVMVASTDPKCPNCKGTVLLDLGEEAQRKKI